MQNNNPLDEIQLQALLRLKRYEQPPPRYFDDLLNHVQRRQREELLRRPAWQIAIDRLRALLAPMRVDWAHAASMAAILLLGVAAIRLALPDRTAEQPQFAAGTDAVAGSKLAASTQTERVVTLRPGGKSIFGPRFEKRVATNNDQTGPDAPTRFIIDTQPVSYEATPIRF